MSSPRHKDDFLEAFIPIFPASLSFTLPFHLFSTGRKSSSLKSAMGSGMFVSAKG